MREDFDNVVRNFEWERPERYNFVRDVVDEWARRDPTQSAMMWVDDHGTVRRRTYSEVARDSRKVANVLAAAGVRRGDTFLLILGRQSEWWDVLTAGLRMGAVVAPGTTQLSAADLKYRLNASGAVAIVTDTANADKVEQVAEACPALKARLVIDGPRSGWIDYAAEFAVASDAYETADTLSQDEALCYFTSGTTGYPKMCIHTHSYPIGHRVTGKYWLDLGPDDLHWNISDTGWAKAIWSSYFGPWHCGAAIFVHHTAGFSSSRVLQLLAEHPITTLCGAPTVYRMLVLEDLKAAKFRSLRHCVAAGEPLNPEIIHVWQQATGMTIRDGFGQTETTLLCCNWPGLPVRPGSMGKPAPGIELRVIDENGEALPAGQEGDIGLKVSPVAPQGFFKEYRNDPDRTRATRRGDWYLTSDRAYVDEDGYFWFVGRADDVILSAGYRIGPFEVESALIEHPAVVEAAVVSSPDATRGEVVKAFVVLVPGTAPDELLARELQEHVKRVTAPYKYPRKIEFVGALPKTVSGKIRRVELRDREWGRR